MELQGRLLVATPVLTEETFSRTVIQLLQHSFAIAEKEPLQMICECAQLDCMARITIGVDVYEQVRAHPDQFLISEGHEDASVDEVLRVEPGYTIVRKKPGEPHDVAVETDPRS